MKKIALAGLLVCSLFSLYSQTLSTGDITPIVGEQFLVHIYNNQPEINLENSGSNQVWNLSNISRSVKTDKMYTVMNPDLTPFSVPSASFAFKYFLTNDSTTIGYRYYKDSIDGFYELMDILPYLNVEYSNPEFVYKLPLKFNDSVIDYSCYTSIVSTFSDKFCGESKLKFDGTGTLVLPTRTYSDVYRLAYNSYYVRQSLGDTIRTTSWIWYKKWVHFPIAEYVKFTMDGTDYITINLLHSSIINNVSEARPGLTFRVYPIPTKRYLTIKNVEISLKDFTITIYDLSGRQLKREHVDYETNELLVDMNDLKGGLYYYYIENSVEAGVRGHFIVE